MVGEALGKSLDEVGDMPREELLLWLAWLQEGRQREN